VFDDKGRIEATYRFGPSDHPQRTSEARLESDVFDNGKPIARLTVAGRATEYDQEDQASLKLIGSEAWRLVLRIRQARKLEIQSRVLQSAVNGIVITDPEGRVEWANPAFERITGYALEEMAGRDLRFLRSGEHEESFYRRPWETITDGRSFNAEFINRRKDGTLVTVEQVITPVVGAGGQIDDEQLLGAIVQITRAVPLEQEALRFDRRRSVALVAHLQAHLGDHHRAPAIGREIEIADAAWKVRDPPCAATAR
jgi:PAS domain S-box-containing protein